MAEINFRDENSPEKLADEALAEEARSIDAQIKQLEERKYWLKNEAMVRAESNANIKGTKFDASNWEWKY